MFGRFDTQVKVTLSKDFVLNKLRENLASHSRLVAEARDGYIKKSSEELEKKLAQVREGKLVSLSFHLTVPKDYSSVYRTTISMLELHTEDKINLEAGDYKKLIDDDWEWAQDFVISNSAYSSGTREYGLSKNLLQDE